MQSTTELKTALKKTGRNRLRRASEMENTDEEHSKTDGKLLEGIWAREIYEFSRPQSTTLARLRIFRGGFAGGLFGRRRGMFFSIVCL